MISNTVIVFLRDLLPIFICYTYMSVLFSKTLIKQDLNCFTKKRVNNFVVGLIFVLSLYFMAETISEWFDGRGLELSHVLLLSSAYICFVVCTLMLNAKEATVNRSFFNRLLYIGFGAIVSVKGTEFLFYFGVHFQQLESLSNMLIGCILGLGICASFSLLFRFFLSELRLSNYAYLLYVFWYCFLAGQVSQITSLLSQVGMLDVQKPLFSLHYLVADSSEYGHILNTLFGYESSVNLQYLVLYLCALCLPILIHYLLSRGNLNHFKKAHSNGTT